MGIFLRFLRHRQTNLYILNYRNLKIKRMGVKPDAALKWKDVELNNGNCKDGNISPKHVVEHTT